MWRSRAKIVWPKYMKIQTFICFPSTRIACYIVFSDFAHIDIEDVYYMAFFKFLKFFLSLLWVIERVYECYRRKRKEKKHISRNKNSDKVSKKVQEERDMRCLMLKARGVEYSKDLWINTGTWGLLEAFGFMQLGLSKHMKIIWL